MSQLHVVTFIWQHVKYFQEKGLNKELISEIEKVSCFGLTAFWDSIQSDRLQEREKEKKKEDRRERKCWNNPHPHLWNLNITKKKEKNANE